MGKEYGRSEVGLLGVFSSQESAWRRKFEGGKPDIVAVDEKEKRTGYFLPEYLRNQIKLARRCGQDDRCSREPRPESGPKDSLQLLENSWVMEYSVKEAE
jgi:hypothetical protein